MNNICNLNQDKSNSSANDGEDIRITNEIQQNPTPQLPPQITHTLNSNTTDILSGFLTQKQARITPNMTNINNSSVTGDGDELSLSDRPRHLRSDVTAYVAKSKNRNVVDWNTHIPEEEYCRILKECFINLCQTGTPSHIEEFLTHHPHFNTHFDNECSFTKACMENTKDMVEYLYNRINPDVTINHDEPFRYACLMNRIEVAYYLQTIYPRYEFTICACNSLASQNNLETDTNIHTDYMIDQDSVKTCKNKETKYTERNRYDEFNNIDVLDFYDEIDETDYDIESDETNEIEESDV